MKRYIGICMAAVLALGVALAASGGEGGDKKAPQTKTGVVKKVDLAAKTLVVMVVGTTSRASLNWYVLSAN